MEQTAAQNRGHDHQNKAGLPCSPKEMVDDSGYMLCQFDRSFACDGIGRIATSEDGALHAEKYYHTTRVEFPSTRNAVRSKQLVALARVTASEYGRTSQGYLEAKELLGVSA
jgi:hypothetical protein